MAENWSRSSRFHRARAATLSCCGANRVCSSGEWRSRKFSPRVTLWCRSVSSSLNKRGRKGRDRRRCQACRRHEDHLRRRAGRDHRDTAECIRQSGSAAEQLRAARQAGGGQGISLLARSSGAGRRVHHRVRGAGSRRTDRNYSRRAHRRGARTRPGTLGARSGAGSCSTGRLVPGSLRGRSGRATAGICAWTTASAPPSRLHAAPAATAITGNGVRCVRRRRARTALRASARASPARAPHGRGHE